MRPKLLLLDEPMAGMGSAESRKLVDLLARLKGRYTIVLIGHVAHDEVAGTLGEAPGHIRLVENEADVDRLQVEDPARVAYLTQTTLGLDDTARIWSAGGNAESIALRGHEGDVTSAEFSPDGKRVITASNDDTARVWTVDGDLLAEMACARAGRNFTRDEWARFFPGKPYRATCPEWPKR